MSRDKIITAITVSVCIFLPVIVFGVQVDLGATVAPYEDLHDMIIPVPNTVMIVDVKLRKNVPVIRKITIMPGHYNEQRQKLSSIGQNTKTRLSIADSSQKTIFETEFDYPRAITIPPAPQGLYDPSTPAVIFLEEPEVSLVIPHFREAFYIEISTLGEFTPNTIEQIENPTISYKSTTDLSFVTPESISAETGKFHVLIMASGYNSSNMSSFTNRANGIKNFLLSKGPFLSHVSDINVHIYSNISDLGCYTGCYNIERLICCDQSKVISAAAASGYLLYDLLIIHNTNTYIEGGYTDHIDVYKSNRYTTEAAV